MKTGYRLAVTLSNTDLWAWINVFYEILVFHTKATTNQTVRNVVSGTTST